MSVRPGTFVGGGTTTTTKCARHYITGLLPDDAAITLNIKQIIGNRGLLTEDPDNVRLIVRSTKRTRSGSGSHHRLALPWKTYNGKIFPDGQTPSTTVFGNHVFGTFQDAMFAFLLWIHGGATGGLRYDLHPHNKRGGAGRFPLVALHHPDRIGIHMGGDDDGGHHRRLAVFLLPTEPSHTVLRRCVATLLADPGFGDGMILIGTLRPVKISGQHPSQLMPQLRGVRLYRCLLPTNPEDLPDALPHGAVEHGWFPCLRNADDAGVRLFFAFHAQTCGEAGTATTAPVVLSPALVPPLHTVGYRMWRRGQSTYALAPKAQAIPDTQWDAMIRRYLQDQSIAADSGTEEGG